MEHTRGKLKITAIAGGWTGLEIEGQLLFKLAYNNEANAIHAVKCWNSHDDLLAVCEMVSNSIFQDCDGEWGSSRPIELLKIIADEAIAKAEK